MTTLNIHSLSTATSCLAAPLKDISRSATCLPLGAPTLFSQPFVRLICPYLFTNSELWLILPQPLSWTNSVRQNHFSYVYLFPFTAGQHFSPALFPSSLSFALSHAVSLSGLFKFTELSHFTLYSSFNLIDFIVSFAFSLRFQMRDYSFSGKGNVTRGPHVHRCHRPVVTGQNNHTHSVRKITVVTFRIIRARCFYSVLRYHLRIQPTPTPNVTPRNSGSYFPGRFSAI